MKNQKHSTLNKVQKWLAIGIVLVFSPIPYVRAIAWIFAYYIYSDSQMISSISMLLLNLHIVLTLIGTAQGISIFLGEKVIWIISEASKYLPLIIDTVILYQIKSIIVQLIFAIIIMGIILQYTLTPQIIITIFKYLTRGKIKRTILAMSIS